MAETEKPILSDKTIVPDNKLLTSLLGEKMKLWLKLSDEIASKYAGSEGSWNYYNDGYQWLFKMVYKKKTLFWAAIYSDTFKVTLYFGDKAEPVLLESDLPQSVKEDFITGRRYGKIRAISTKIMNNDDVDLVLKLTDIKSKLK